MGYIGVTMDTAIKDSSKESLHEILVRTGMIAGEQMQDALQIARKDDKTVEQVLIEKELLTSHDVAAAVSLQLRVPLIDLKSHRVHREALRLVPEKLARKYNVLPLDIIGGSLIVVMGNTMDVQAIDDISAVSKMRIETMMAVADDIRNAIDRNYTATTKIEDESATSAAPAAEEEAGPEELIAAEAEAPALRHLNLIIQQAMRARASDIHLKPREDSLQVRFRIDGVLHDAMSLPLNIRGALMSRLKIVGGMNIAERRRPQDGRFSVHIDDVDIDVRVACGNTVRGEMAVLRLLPQSAPMLDLARLGLSPSILERYQRMLKLPFGMILFGGPTGSGKTTTLYASINQLNQTESNIMTIEDPVEYHFADISQFQVNPKAGIDFANSLRAFMRLDPDVILVGEIRDTETARIATQAALTGHLVFSSVHANDAVSVILRLQDLGVEPFFICSALAGTVSQRILRRICPHCQAPYEPTTEERMAYQEEMGEPPPQLYNGAGCNFCADTGYLGRVGLFELFVLTEEAKQLFIDGATAGRLREQAIKDGMVPLMHDGMLKVKEGITTISEVLRNVFSVDHQDMHFISKQS
ncbi:MAG: type II/IV secretion system protein [Dehalococcoidia bacterium]|nr:MAG: type II/IV secretion system protein [Dehalococcoidia bacterium]